MEKFTSDIIEKIRNNKFEKEYEYTFLKINDYLNIKRDNIFPKPNDLELLDSLDVRLNKEPESTKVIIEKLAYLGEKTTVLSSSARYFGFVVGSFFPVSLQARLLADTWDQNSALYLMSPLASKIEEVCEKWLIELLSLPKNSVVGIVSGSATATILALNAAFQKINNKNRSQIKIVISNEAHATVFKSLKILGITNSQINFLKSDSNGKIIIDDYEILDNNSVLILQAGNVNGGAYDDFKNIIPKAKEKGAWVHIDGAFGLYVNCCHKLKHLTNGIELADSWTVDAHKTLNTPYDNGIVICKDKEAYLESLKVSGTYIVASSHRDGMMYTNEMSRRARSIELWATLKALGKQGVSDLVYELASKTVYFARALENIGFEVINEVVFNQIVCFIGDDDITKQILDDINSSGVCFMSSSNWKNKFVIRVSISSYKTTFEDIDYCIKEIDKIIDKSQIPRK